MCGFTGFITSNKEFSNYNLVEILKKMNNSLIHRGPNDGNEIVLNDHNLFMAFRRLSILDLSDYAMQPMISTNKNFIMTFNGEIYNFKELNNKFLNNKYQNTSDTKVLIELFSALGVYKTLDYIEGMFSISLYDISNKILYLIRDKVGKKPLYYHKNNNIFIWGSELKSLNKNPLFEKKIDNMNLSNFLRLGYIPGEQCIYQNSNKVEAGCLIEFKNNKITKKKYSKIEPEFSSIKKYSDEENINFFHQELSNSVKKRLISDVPIGSFLSGGIDSTLITSIMASHKSNIDTFTIGFDDLEFDESQKSKNVANVLGTNHNEMIIQKKDYLDIIPSLSNVYDEPFSDSSQIPTMLVSKLAKSKVTVALSGDGGDELFCGYNRYILLEKYFKYYLKFPALIRKNLLNLLLKILKYNKTLFNLSSDQHQKIENLSNINNTEELYSHLISAPTFSDKIFKNSFNFYKLYFEKNIDPLAFMQKNDYKYYLPDDILTKVDRASMNYSLEVRCPFLDDNIVKNICKISKNQKFKNNKSKWILREILKKYINPKIIEDKKRGFGIPLENLLRNELKEWVIDNVMSKKNEFEYFNYKEIQKILDQHFSGEVNNHFLIWNLSILHSWKNNWS